MKTSAILLLAITTFLIISASDSTKKSKDKTAQTMSAVDTTGASSGAIDGRYWKLTEIMGKPVDTGLNKKPHIQFNADGNRISGSSGCNNFAGSYTLKENGRILFSQVANTQMACMNMETESAFLKVLETADSYLITGDKLELHKARMTPLARFVAVEMGSEAAKLNGTWELNYISGTSIAFDGLYPDKKPTITFNLPEIKATGNSSCNGYSS